MKLIIAIIPPDRLESVKASLAKVDVYRLTLQDVQGFGRQKGRSEMFQGTNFQANLVRKVQLMIAVNDEFVDPTIDAIVDGGRAGTEGRIGDGKIFVLPLDECVRIRTGEHGPDAI